MSILHSLHLEFEVEHEQSPIVGSIKRTVEETDKLCFLIRSGEGTLRDTDEVIASQVGGMVKHVLDRAKAIQASNKRKGKSFYDSSIKIRARLTGFTDANTLPSKFGAYFYCSPAETGSGAFLGFIQSNNADTNNSKYSNLKGWGDSLFGVFSQLAQECVGAGNLEPLQTSSPEVQTLVTLNTVKA